MAISGRLEAAAVQQSWQTARDAVQRARFTRATAQTSRARAQQLRAQAHLLTFELSGAAPVTRRQG